MVAIAVVHPLACGAPRHPGGRVLADVAPYALLGMESIPYRSVR